MSDRGFSRRYFFQGALLAGAVPAAGFGSVPSLKALGYKPYLRQAQHRGHRLRRPGRRRIRATPRAPRTSWPSATWMKTAPRRYFKRFDKAPKYKDFRVMLDKEGKNIDACIVGRAGFHARHRGAGLHGARQAVYVEKPLTRTPWEARLLRDAAVKYKVATQMGNQGFSHECTPRGGRDGVVGRHRRRDGSAHLDHARDASHGLAAAAAGIAGPRHARLGPLAGRRRAASLQRPLRALQLARVSGFRHGADRQLGHPHRVGRCSSRCNWARPPAWNASRPGGQERHHVSQSRRSCGWNSRRAERCPR